MTKKKTFKWLLCGLTTIAIAAAPVSWLTFAQDKTPGKPTADEKPYKPKTKRELQRQLTPLQFEVTQNEGTEHGNRGKIKAPNTWKELIPTLDLPRFP